jgi:hypothetical protein
MLMNFLRIPYCAFTGRRFFIVLEQNQSFRGVDESVLGGFFLRKKPLECIVPLYTNSDFAIAGDGATCWRRYEQSGIREEGLELRVGRSFRGRHDDSVGMRAAGELFQGFGAGACRQSVVGAGYQVRRARRSGELGHLRPDSIFQARDATRHKVKLFRFSCPETRV